MVFGDAQPLIGLHVRVAVHAIDLVARILHEQPRLRGEHRFERRRGVGLVIAGRKEGVGVIDGKSLARARIHLAKEAFHQRISLGHQRIVGSGRGKVGLRQRLDLLLRKFVEIVIGKAAIECGPIAVDLYQLLHERLAVHICSPFFTSAAPACIPPNDGRRREENIGRETGSEQSAIDDQPVRTP